MAKKTIKAQMKQRRDTKANWAATNPVLLDGELGIVSDDPNLYKVGDGATAWNSLPFRGFDGTLAQELGTSPNAVMSQKVVSEKLTEIESRSADGEVLSDYYVSWSTGELIRFNGMIYSETPVSQGMTLLYKAFPQEDAKGLAFYDSDGNYIKGYKALTKEQIIEVPNNATLCKASLVNYGDVVFYGYNKSIADLMANTICRKGPISSSNIATLNDLDEFSGNTIYYVTTASIGEQVQNKPDNSSNFQVYTFSPIDKSVVFQIFISANGTTYMRSRWGSWGAWKKIESYDNIKQYVDDNIQSLKYDSAWDNVVTEGEYISNSGAYVNFGGFSIARGILKAGQKLIIKAAGYLDDVAMISVQSEDGYNVKVTSTDETSTPTLKEYSWINDSYADVQVAVSFYAPHGLEAWIVQDNSIFESGFGIIHHDEYIAWSSGVVAPFVGFKYIEMPVSQGMKLIYKYTTDYLDARGLAFYGSNGAFIKGFQTLESTQYIDVPDGAVMCRATVSKHDDIYLYAYNNALAEVGNIASNINILSAFDNIVCVGDSLTFSQVYTSAKGSRQARVTYPQALARMCGNQQMTLARAGATALTCWDEFNGQIVTKENALAIIYLGTNYGVTDTLDEDVVGDNPDNWANNNIGAYCRFIKRFQDLGYKVLLLNIWATSGTGDSSLANTQEAIRHIAERFQCAVMDAPVTGAMEYHYYPDLSGYNGVHYNDLGYSWFASQLINKVGKLSTDQIKWIIPNA